MKMAFDFMITLGLFVLANWLSNSIEIELMKSGFTFHDNFRLVHFWRIASLNRLESSKLKVAFDFMITLGLFILPNW
jgi:hypothetical protein